MTSSQLQEASENPQFFYSNVLVDQCYDSKDFPCIEELPYSCVLYFLYHQSIQPVVNHLDDYVKRHKRQLQTESDIIHRNEELKASAEFEQLVKCPIVRDFLFAEERGKLDCCNSVEDFEEYIDSYSHICREFTLYSQYRIALAGNIPFEGILEVIKDYPQSDLFPVEELRSQCETIDGIAIRWKIGINDAQKDCIRQIINQTVRFCRKDVDSFLSNIFLTKKQRLILEDRYNRHLESLSTDINVSEYVSFEEASRLIDLLTDFTGLKWELPRLESLLGEGLSQIPVWCNVGNKLGTYSHIAFAHLIPIISNI